MDFQFSCILYLHISSVEESSKQSFDSFLTLWENEIGWRCEVSRIDGGDIWVISKYWVALVFVE